MNDLVITHDQQVVTTSLKVAKVFGKCHTDVTEAIRHKIQRVENSAGYASMFKGVMD